MAELTNSPSKPARTWLSRNVIVLGFVSLLNDTASEMVIPLLPVYLTVTLGAGAFALGWIEGIADATSSVLKLVTGRLADKAGRMRPFVVVGYSITSVVRPLIALAAVPWHVLATRAGDRVGKGVRTSPRDALIAASVRPEQRGAAFSLHRGMDHAGAVIGPLAAAAFLYWVSDDLRLLFWLTAIPGALVVLVVVAGVKEQPRAPAKPGHTTDAPQRGLARFLIPLGLFTLGNASDVFLLLKAGGEHVDLVTFPLLWVGLHVVKMLASVPGGMIGDRLGQRRTIAVGWLLYAAVYSALGFAEEQWVIWTLLGLYGVYHGLTEGPERALVAQVAPSRKHGAAYGWYHLTLGLLSLAASVMFGALWEWAGSRTAFLVSAGLAVAAVLALAALWRGQAGPVRHASAG